MKRATTNLSGAITFGPEIRITTGSVNAAIPSVAITANGTIGVFYYTCDRVPPASPFPVFTAHFAISTDGGATFPTGINLETFLSPALDNGNARQRVLGDYMQVKAVGNTFLRELHWERRTVRAHHFEQRPDLLQGVGQMTRVVSQIWYRFIAGASTRSRCRADSMQR